MTTRSFVNRGAVSCGCRCALIALTASWCVAQETPRGDSFGARLDRWHEAVTDNIVAAVERFDRLFGDERLDEESTGTRVGLALGVRADAADGARLETRLRLRIALPNLEKRVQLLFEDEAASELEPVTRDLAESIRDSRPVTGLRLLTEPFGRARLSLDTGSRWSGGPELFVRSRLSLVKSGDHWERRLAQTLAWFTNDGWAARLECRVSLCVAENRFLRTTTALGWKEQENGVTPQQTFDFLRAIGKGGGYRWTLRAEWPETPECRRAVYAIEHGRRVRLYRDWLFGEAVVGLDFAQERDYETNPFAALRLEISFEQ